MSNYYAVDQTPIEPVLDELLCHLKSSKNSATHLIALLDSAFDHGAKTLAWAEPSIQLYGEGPLGQLRAVSPVLAFIETKDERKLIHQLRRLLRHSAGRPMLSFVQTDLSAESLSAHWQVFLTAETGDAQRYLLRWADTRVLPTLARSLPTEAWRSVTRPLHAWLILSRRGHLEHLSLPEGRQQVSALTSGIKLGSMELESLLKEGEPDAVIQALSETLPTLLPETGRADFYDRIVECCRLAERHSVEAFPDVVALAAAECASGGDLLTDPRLKGVLAARDWQPGKLSDRLMELMPQEVECLQ